MGRYYSGDIEGKFAFACQSSDDGEFFGAESQESSSISYYTEDLETAEAGVQKCIAELGEYKEKLDAFFEAKDSYNYAQIASAFEITEEEIKLLLEWYFRLDLGIKIRDCIKEHGSCMYNAEM